MLFDNAAAKGADCYDQTRVQAVRSTASGPWACVCRGAAERRRCRRQVVVDATGQQALIANALRLRIDDPKLRNAAIWGYYRNACRDPGENGGATIILHTQGKQSWFWFIPLSNEITSIGVVGRNDYLLRGRGKPAEVFPEELAKCPALGERLAEAEFLGEFHVAKEFSYTTRQQAGDGWVLVGDAFGFIDPIYSSGVYLALRSGELAADAIVGALRKGDTSRGSVGLLDSRVPRGHRLDPQAGRRLLHARIQLRPLPQGPSAYRGNLTDLLIGRVFHDGAGRIFDDMTPAIEQAQRMAAELPSDAAMS